MSCVSFGREIDEAQSFRVLDYAFEHGISLPDTAEGCGGGRVESADPAAEMHSPEKIMAAQPGGAANEDRAQL